jgi:hypothetical protein
MCSKLCSQKGKQSQMERSSSPFSCDNNVFAAQAFSAQLASHHEKSLGILR